MEVLTTTDLTKFYGRIRAVDHLNLTIQKGMVFGILGPNGSGKTTTLGMIMDVINQSEGTYRWFGEPPTKESRKKIGAILETPVFYPYLSGFQNLQIIAKIKGALPANIPKVLKQVGLYDRKDDAFKTYSLGMKQRLSLAGALVNDPIVLILDEPTNGLDPQGIAEVRRMITDIAETGKTIVLASHLLDEVQKVCSHFGILRQGKLLYSGSVEEVSKQTVAIEVGSENANLESTLANWENVEGVQKEKDLFVVSLKNDVSSVEVNEYLFGKGIVASHLKVRKKSLEKQFLEILKESN